MIAHLVLGWVVVSLLVTVLGLIAPLLYYLHRRDRRRGAMQDGLVDAIGQLRDAIRTGLSVQNALVSLAHSGPQSLRPEFARLAREIRLLGFEPAIRAMRERLADPVFDVVAASLVLNDRLGGRNVSQVLDRLAQATRAELRVQQEIRAYQAKNVLSAQIVAGVPLVVLIAIRAINPSYLALFDGWPGQLLLAGCVVSIALGYAGMLWITRLPGEQRVLQP
jgi:tight adherence protein B